MITAALISKRNPEGSTSENKWRTGARERAYRRRLVEALCRARGGSASGPRAVKEAADSALALTARGRSRWSRAILFGRRGGNLLLKARGRVLVRRGRPRMVAAPRPEGKRVRDSLRTLRWLVPGCRKVSTSSLLKESADYVAALEMQVKANRAIVDARGCGRGRLPGDLIYI